MSKSSLTAQTRSATLTGCRDLSNVGTSRCRTIFPSKRSMSVRTVAPRSQHSLSLEGHRSSSPTASASERIALRCGPPSAPSTSRVAMAASITHRRPRTVRMSCWLAGCRCCRGLSIVTCLAAASTAVLSPGNIVSSSPRT
eukprot:3935392-Rhodomonas_salina.1